MATSEHTSALEAAQARSEEAEAAYRAARRNLERACVEARTAGMTLEAIGSVLGMSKQAAAQLVNRGLTG